MSIVFSCGGGGGSSALGENACYATVLQYMQNGHVRPTTRVLAIDRIGQIRATKPRDDWNREQLVPCHDVDVAVRVIDHVADQCRRI